jgi:hypothetical protein
MAFNLEIEITLADVKLILTDRFDEVFHKAMHTNACPGCPCEYNATLVIKEIWLNHIGDLIVEGTCKDCGFTLSRYIEASNFTAAYDQALNLRELKMEVLQDYRARPAGS